MNRVDYSKDFIFLRNIEIDDFDTQSYVETGHHPTGINDGRMRLPTRYDIAKFYKRNKRNSEKGYWVRKTADAMPDISDDFDWQITYTFPATLRNPKTAKGSYGGKHVTFRRLYLILCEHFNGGSGGLLGNKMLSRTENCHVYLVVSLNGGCVDGNIEIAFFNKLVNA
jgi:hypothetical protein